MAEQDHSGEASKVIEGLQDSALYMVSLYCELMEKLEVELSVPTIEVFHPYQTMIRKKSRTLVKMLERLDAIDRKPMVFCFNRGLKDYIVKPHQFKMDFSNTAYKSLFLEHTFRIKLPYVDIIAKFRKFE